MFDRLLLFKPGLVREDVDRRGRCGSIASSLYIISHCLPTDTVASNSKRLTALEWDFVLKRTLRKEGRRIHQSFATLFAYLLSEAGYSDDIESGIISACFGASIFPHYVRCKAVGRLQSKIKKSLLLAGLDFRKRSDKDMTRLGSSEVTRQQRERLRIDGGDGRGNSLAGALFVPIVGNRRAIIVLHRLLDLVLVASRFLCRFGPIESGPTRESVCRWLPSGGQFHPLIALCGSTHLFPAVSSV